MIQKRLYQKEFVFTLNTALILIYSATPLEIFAKIIFMKQEILNFYKSQGERTELDDGVYARFSKELEGIFKEVQNILIHIEQVHHENIDSKPENKSQRNPKTIAELLAKIEFDDPSKPLPPDKKTVGICRNFSMFLVSILRHSGVPARTRCGFATYFPGGVYEDHWIAEYWNLKEKRWFRVDAQMNDYWKKELWLQSYFFNPLDLKKGQFFTAGEIWELYRDGLIDERICGYSTENKFGEYYIRGNLLLDFFALNKVEYTYQEQSRLMKEGIQLQESDFDFLDTLADLTKNPERNFKEIRKISKEKLNIRP